MGDLGGAVGDVGEIARDELFKGAGDWKFQR